jgi:hypothetical protein
MNDIYKMIEGVFPNTEILLIYYGGSIAYRLDDESSDQDITVVLDGFKGTIHLYIGKYDFFVFSKEEFIKRQKFDETVIPYYKQAADSLIGFKDKNHYIAPSFEIEINELLGFIDETFIVNHLSAVIEYTKSRFGNNSISKTHYHVFRIRGMVDHYEKTGKYELVVEEPWYSKMMEFKKNWDNELAEYYVEEIKEQLVYLENYRSEMMKSGLG